MAHNDQTNSLSSSGICIFIIFLIYGSFFLLKFISSGQKAKDSE